MDTEIELKLLVPEGADKTLKNYFFKQLDGQVEASQFHLSNCYYDTDDKQLRALDMGMRVRGRDGQFEQTIKTAGQSVGGLHQRPEYNVALSNSDPDLTLFDPAIWPDGTDVEQLQEQLIAQFTTSFLRQAFLYTEGEDSAVEFAFDCGEVCAGNHSVPICELELELVKGSTQTLFDLALKLSYALPFRLGIQSKAARGFMLAAGSQLEPTAPPGNVTLPTDASLEYVVIQSLSAAMNYWQHHEQSYLDTGKIAALEGVWRGQRWLLQLLRQFNTVWQLAEFEQLSEQLHELCKSWRWVPEIRAIKRLRSERGPFRKKLTPMRVLMSYLQGRQHGILRQNKPQELLKDGRAGRIQLGLLQCLYQRPWRESATNWDSPARDVSSDCLQTGWESVLQKLGTATELPAEKYLEAEHTLNEAILRSYAFAELYQSDSRKAFRSSWLDVLDGIEELYTLKVLQQELPAADLHDDEDLYDWSESKIARILDVMQQSRILASQILPYW